MARVFITGSSDGLGKMAAELLIEQGHKVVLHTRNEVRAKQTSRAVRGAEAMVIGDLSSIGQTKEVASQVNALGVFDAVIHNAGVGYREPKRMTEDGLPHVFAINTLAPYILTATIKMPKRLGYLSSGMHHSAGTDLSDLTWSKRSWNGSAAYAETKFQDVLLAFAAARLFPEVHSNALEPGWVPTKMGGTGAPDHLDLGSPHPGMPCNQQRSRGPRIRDIFPPSEVAQSQAPPRATSPGRRSCWKPAGN